MACSLLFLVLVLLASPSAADVAAIQAEAHRLLDSGKSQEAARLIEEKSLAADRDADLWFLLAEAYHVTMDDAGILKKRGLAKKMRSALETALQLDPEHVDSRRQLADFYFYAPWIVGGDKDKAAEQLDLLEQVDAAEAWAIRGEYARSAGDYDAAAGYLGKALEHDPDETRHLFALAVIEQQRQRFDESMPLLNEVIANNADHEDAYYYRARGAALSGSHVDLGLASSAHYLRICTKCDDVDRGYAWWRRATLLGISGETDAAIAAYQEALRLNPKLENARKELLELAH